MNTIDLFSTPSTARNSLQNSSSMHSRDSASLAMDSPPSSIMATEGTQSLDLPCSTCSRTTSSFDFASDNEVDFLELSDEPPTYDRLALAGNINVYDEHGNSRPFHTLYRGAEHQGQRQLIIFVRHFFCGACQAYLKALTETITPAVYFSLPIPTTITIIACGEAAMLPQYGNITRCPFRMYTEPTRKLYRIFGMPRTMNFGSKPKYVDDSPLKMVYDVTKKLVKIGATEGYYAATAAGPIWQVGGEFLFEQGEIVWCHRMRNIRGHAEMDVLRTVLGVPVESSDLSSSSCDASERSHSSPKLSSSQPTSPTLPSRHFTGSEKLTYVEPERPRRLQLVVDDSGDVPKARLKRRSANLDA